MENDNDLKKKQSSDWSSPGEPEIAPRISSHHRRVRLAGARVSRTALFVSSEVGLSRC